MVVEFVPGGSLEDVLLDSRIPAQTHDANYANICSKLSERDLLKIAKDVANGMRHLERRLVSDRCALASVDGSFSACTGKHCILGHLGLVFIWSCFGFCLLFLLFYVICAPVPAEGTLLTLM